MWNWIKKADELKSKGTVFALVTVTRVIGSVPRETGAKMIVLEDRQILGTIGGGHLELLVIDEAVKSLKQSNPPQTLRFPLGAKTGQCCGGIVEVLIEPIGCGPSLYLFGAGHVAQAVCKSLTGTPFSVHLIDERPEWVQSSEISNEVIRYPMEWSDFVSEANWNDQKTYVAVMTHRHDLDQEIIQEIIQRPARYIGLIGSESKWKRFQQRLSARGVSESSLGRVKCPIGIPIGGKAPQEVAISLAAELLQIHYVSSHTPRGG